MRDYIDIVEGDTVLVSDNGREWVKRIFVLEHKGIYYTEGLEDNKQLVAWKYCTLCKKGVIYEDEEIVIIRKKTLNK